MQVTKSSLEPGRTKISHSTTTIPTEQRQREESLHTTVTSTLAGPPTSPPPLARNIPVSPALEKFRYRPPPEPTSDEEGVPQASSPPRSPRKRIKVQPIRENTDAKTRNSRTRTAQPAATPPPLPPPLPPPPPPTLILPEYDEFGEIVIPESQASQDHTLQDSPSSLQDCEPTDQTFEVDLPSSIELPSQLARHIQMDQSSTRPRTRSADGSGPETQPSKPEGGDLYDGSPTNHREGEPQEDLSNLLEELEASSNLEANLAFSDDEKDELEAAELRVVTEATNEPLPDLPPLVPSGSPKPAPNRLVSEVIPVALVVEQGNESLASSFPYSSPRKVVTDDPNPMSSPSRTLRALSSHAAKETDHRPSVELRTPLASRTNTSAAPRQPLIATQIRNGSASLDYLMAKHTPILERPTHRLVPLTPEGFSTHLTRMLDSYRGETAASKALVESQDTIIDEQGDEIIRLRGEVTRLEVTERRNEKLTNRIEVLEEIRRGLLDMLHDKENECQALRDELELNREKLEAEKEKDGRRIAGNGD